MSAKIILNLFVVAMTYFLHSSASQMKCDNHTTLLLQILEHGFLPNFSATKEVQNSAPPKCNSNMEDPVGRFRKQIFELEKILDQISDRRFCELVSQLNATYLETQNMGDSIQTNENLDLKFEMILNGFIKTRNHLRKHYINLTITDCDSSILSNQKIFSDKEISEYMESSYSSYKLMGILDFLRNLPWVKPSLVGYSLIYNKTKNDKNLNPLITLEIASQIKVLSDSEHFKKSETYKILFKELKNSTDTILNYWAQLIKNRKNINFQDFYNFENSFNFFLPELLNKAYDVSGEGKQRYMFKLYMFLKANEDKNCMQAPGYNALFEIYKKHKLFDDFVDLFVLSYRMNRTLENSAMCDEKISKLLKENYVETNVYIDEKLKTLEGSTVPWGFEVYELVHRPRTFAFFAETLVRHSYLCREEIISDLFIITILTRIAHKVMFPTFYNEMNRCNQSSSFPIILMAKNIEDHVSSDNNETKIILYQLLKDMNKDVKSAINQTAMNLRKGNHSSLIQYANDYETYYIPALEQIISKAYQNDLNIIRNILELGKQSQYKYIDYSTYLILFKEMERNNFISGCPILMLASYMKIAYGKQINYEEIAKNRNDLLNVNIIFDYANETLQLWQKSLENNDFNNIVECFKFSNRSLIEYEQGIIKNVFQRNSSFAENIISYSKQFNDVFKQMEISGYLFNEIYENEQIKSPQSVKLLFSVKKAFEMCEESNCPIDKLLKSQRLLFQSYIRDNLFSRSSNFVDTFQKCFGDLIDDQCIVQNISKWKS